MRQINNEEVIAYGASVRDRRERSNLRVQSLAEMVDTPVWLMKLIEKGVIDPIAPLRSRIEKSLIKYESFKKKPVAHE